MGWDGAANRFEHKVDRSRLPGKAADAIAAADCLHVACSGGADSVFALLLCSALRKDREPPGELEVLHFNHRLRGAAAEEDARFVGDLAVGLGLPCEIGQASWPKDPSAVTEAEARQARLSFFSTAMAGGKDGSTLIATGHHADDIAETMLMRLSRGSGVEGLCAPRPLSEAGAGLRFVRPLLGYSRREIREILQACGIAWREDASNDSDAHYRNRLRRAVVPAWNAAADREVRIGLQRSRQLLEEDADALDAVAEAAWRQGRLPGGTGLRRGALQEQPVAIQRRLLQRLVEEREGSGAFATAGLVEAFLDDLGHGREGRYALGPGLYLDLDGKRVQLRHKVTTPPWSEFRLPLGCSAYFPDGAALKAERSLVTPELRSRFEAGQNDNGSGVYLRAAEKQSAWVAVRRRQPGDAFKPLGKTSAKKLKTLLIDQKIEVEERDRLPIVLSPAGEILWVPGLPPNADQTLSRECAAALRLTYQR